MSHNDAAMLGTSGYARNERDWYPTPREATLPITTFFADQLVMEAPGAELRVWEPAAGDDAMGAVLREAGFQVHSSDIHPMAPGIETRDFLKDPCPEALHGIITNPPYGEMAQAFIERALEHIASGKVNFAAMLLRLEYSSAVTRRHLFSECKFYAGRINLTFRPRWVADSKGSPRHNYTWFVWAQSPGERPFDFYAHRTA